MRAPGVPAVSEAAARRWRADSGVTADLSRRTLEPFVGVQVAPLDIGHGACTSRCHTITRNRIMGKYLIAWILGVPAFVLVIIYLLFN